MTTVAQEPTQEPALAQGPGLTAGLLCLTFVPFGLGLVAAIWYAELSENLLFYRAIYTVRLALILAIPALVLFPFRLRSPGIRNAWRLFWTFSFIAYAIHFAYSWFGVFGGQVETARLHPELFHVPENPTILDLVIAHQGTFVAYSNFVVMALWLIDVVVAWFERGRGPRRIAPLVLHVLTWLYVFVSFVIASIVFGKNPVIHALGYTLVGAVVLALPAWLLSRGRGAEAVGP